MPQLVYTKDGLGMKGRLQIKRNLAKVCLTFLFHNISCFRLVTWSRDQSQNIILKCLISHCAVDFSSY